MLVLGDEFKDLLKSEIIGGAIKRTTQTGLTIGAGQTYQIPDFPSSSSVLYMTIMLKTGGNPSSGTDNFIVIDSGYNYLTGSSNFSGTYKGIYVSVSRGGLISVSDYRHGGVDVIGYRIVYIDA